MSPKKSDSRIKNKKYIDSKINILLEGFDRQTAVRVKKLIKLFGLGVNKSEEIIFLLKKSSIREKTDILSIISSRDFARYINLKKQGVIGFRELKKYLNRRANPVSSSYQSKYEDISAKLNLGPNAVLRHSPNFETDDYEISLKFRSLGEYKMLLEKLAGLESNPHLDRLFKLLKNED